VGGFWHPKIGLLAISVIKHASLKLLDSLKVR